MRVGLLIALVFASLAWPPSASKAELAQEPSACSLRSNFDFLRDLVFTSAATIVPGKSAPLNDLKRAVTAQGVDVRAVSYDPATGRIECSMTLRLSLPVSSRGFFGGATEISAPVQYWAEPADGGGFSVVTRGLGVLSARVADAARRFPQTPDFALSPQIPKPAQRSEALPTPVIPKRLLHPGFDCANASSRTELMICDSEALAETDRLLAERYFAARKNMRPSGRRQLLVGQRAFLARRDRCDTEACLVGLYMARKAELDPYPVAAKRHAN